MTSAPTAGPPTRPDARVRALHAALAAFPASLFQFDPRIADGWLSDRYFLRSAATLAHAERDPTVTMQLFAKHHGIVAGLYEGVRMLQTQLAGRAAGARYVAADLTVETLMDGDAIAPWETVMLVRGPYRAFAHLETPLLGVIARRTLIATNVRRVIDAADGKAVIFMGARHDDWRVQTPDGYAARVGGAGSVSSDAGGAWWGASGAGTMPHALIAAFGGDVVAATLAFARYAREHEPDVGVVSLVDYHNDVVGDALAVARAMREHFGPGALAGVRVDTSEKLIDRSLLGEEASYPGETLTGVSRPLVRKLRAALDAEGFADVGIVVSGGFTPRKIAAFERANVPVTAYGVGSSLLGHNRSDADGLLTGFDFTADLVEVDGRPESKAGRTLRPNPRLVRVDWSTLGRGSTATAV
jgi:nicotinate phosphoribosyltransferase